MFVYLDACTDEGDTSVPFRANTMKQVAVSLQQCSANMCPLSIGDFQQWKWDVEFNLLLLNISTVPVATRSSSVIQTVFGAAGERSFHPQNQLSEPAVCVASTCVSLL